MDVLEIDQDTPLQYNLFTYCHNNPIGKVDTDGCLPFLVVTGLLGAAIGGIVGAITTGTVEGALAGAAIGGVIGLGGGAAVAATVAGSATASCGAVAIGAQLWVGGIGKAGYASYHLWKAANGAAGDGKAWHHIVGQHAANIEKFGAEVIHHFRNIVSIPHGPGTLHNAITSLYISKQVYTNNLRVWEWLSSQSFREQYNFGLEQLARLCREMGESIWQFWK